MDRKSRQCFDVSERNSRYIPGGISSANRAIDPAMVFARAKGAYLWDQGGKRYVDYHGAFGPYFLGHNCAPINQAVADVMEAGESL